MQKGFAPAYFLIGILVLVLVAGGAYYFSKSQTAKPQIPNPMIVFPTPQATLTPSPTPDKPTQATPTLTSIKITQVQGADLKDIKYTLSQNWEAEIRKDALGKEGLSIAPKSGGGFFFISVYDYPGTPGRRQYYCQVSKVCIEGTSYFTETNIGNISGYTANAVDNSGGGTEYFGAKGNKFYIISSYSPPSPNEFGKNRQNVLDSLIF